MAIEKPITLNNIHIEAGGSGVSGTLCTINDSDIRGLIGKGSGVPMSFSEWEGAASSYLVPFNFGTISVVTLSSGTVYAYLTIRTTKVADPYPNGSDQTWLAAGGAVGDYQVRFTQLSGSLNYGVSPGTWYTCSSNRSCGISASSGGFLTKVATMKVEIRKISDTSDIITDSTITLRIEIEK